MRCGVSNRCIGVQRSDAFCYDRRQIMWVIDDTNIDSVKSFTGNRSTKVLAVWGSFRKVILQYEITDDMFARTLSQLLIAFK